MTRPSMEETMMCVARLMARRSTCARLRVGCVIADARLTSIYSIGYNGNYRGGPNECDRPDPGDCGCLHAEDNALVKLRTEERGLVLFTTVSPCTACAKRIVNQGNVDTVWYDQPHRDLQDGLAVLQAGCVGVRVLSSGTGTMRRIIDDPCHTEGCGHPRKNHHVGRGRPCAVDGCQCQEFTNPELRLCLHCHTKYEVNPDLHAGGVCPGCGSPNYEPAVASDYKAALNHQREPKPRYMTKAVLNEHTLDACREADGLTVTEPVVHGEGCRCTFEQVTDG